MDECVFAQPAAHKHMQKCHGKSRRVFSNISPARDLDSAGVLFKCIGDSQLGGLSNALDDSTRIPKDLNRKNW